MDQAAPATRGSPGKIRAAVVGLGYFGSFHANHYAKHADADLVAVVDTDRSRAEKLARDLGAEAFTHHRALIGKVAGDVSEVKTPGGIREYEVLDVRYR